MRRERGFSMLLVLLVLIVLAIVGITALTIGNSEAGVAEARAVQRQALAAADAGLNHFLGSSPPSITPNTYYVGAAGSDPTHFVYLRETRNSVGQTMQSRYRVRTTNTAPLPNSLYVLSEGEVLVGDHVVGRSLLTAIISATPGAGSNVAGQGQKAIGAWGTSSNLPARTDISLTDL